MGFFSKLGDIIEGAFKSAVSFIKGSITFNFEDILESVQILLRDVVAPILEPVFAVLGIKDKTIHAVEVVTIKLIEGESKFFLDTVISTITNNRDLTEELVLANITGPISTARSFLKYGENHYINGLPEVNINSYVVNSVAVKAVLESIENESVNILTTSLSLPNDESWCRWYLVENYGYNYQSNTLVLDSITWEFSSYIFNEETDDFSITLSREVSVGVTEYMVLPTTAPVYELELYYEITYTLVTNPSETKLWIYKLTEGTYPVLQVQDTAGDTDTLQTLPIVVLREEFVNVNVDKESAKYKTSNKLLNILNVVQLDSLIEQINNNPDIDKIQDAFVLFGANLYTSDINTKSYLFNLFQTISLIPGYDKATFLSLTEPEKSKSGFIYAIKEQRYNTVINFNYAENIRVDGSIGPIDTVELSFNILPNTVAGTEIVVQEATETEPEVIEISDGLINSSITLRYQRYENEYIEVEIGGLILSTYINTDGDAVQLKVMELVDPDDPAFADARKNFIIPLSYRMLTELPPREAEQIIYDSLHLVLYAKSSTHLEYYQTPEFFQLINIAIKIAAIVITIISLGSASSISTALWALGEQLLIQVALDVTLREILKHGLSDELKALAILAYVYAASTLAGADFGDLFSNLADTLLLSISAISTALQIDTSLQAKDLIKEQQRANERALETTQELNKAKKELTLDTLFDSEVLLFSNTKPVLDIYSTPQQFYNRCLTTNVAPLVLSYPRTYVNNKLNLNNIRPLQTNVEIDLSTEIQLI